VSRHAERLAGIREAVPLAEASVYHAVARAAALDAFARAFEAGEGAPPDGPDASDASDPEYVLASTADGELLIVAGAWQAAGRTCGRLVAPRELLALLLDDPERTAVWCDEDDGEGLALTAHAITVDGEPLLLVEARSARATGEVAGVTQVDYDGERLRDGAWDAGALDALLRERDGDVVALSPAVVAELARQVGEADAP
jgi:hypothetical protein